MSEEQMAALEALAVSLQESEKPLLIEKLSAAFQLGQAAQPPAGQFSQADVDAAKEAGKSEGKAEAVASLQAKAQEIVAAGNAAEAQAIVDAIAAALAVPAPAPEG